ncbi:YecA family protein [Colwellia piezophila]|uniref:YecA family protein n=1 Tax=Colwellia piezophila TaxID=211668 RepID=UPI000376187B|nr:SEC-C metal-binding domain-containing protein [Colwellia piezophila]
MSKLSRNDPCHCGSGKKYKKCCLLSIQPSAAQVTSQLSAAMAEQNFGSLDEMQSFMDQQVTQQNNQARDEFHGLSPTQMHLLLNFPLEDQQLLGWQPQIDERLIEQSPIIRVARCLMNSLAAAPIKATAKGNLPQVIVKQIYAETSEQLTALGLCHSFVKVNREDNFDCLLLARMFLTDIGVIKYQKQHYSLTKKGTILNSVQIYQRLFDFYTQQYNWAYQDGYPEVPLFAQTTSFALIQLQQLKKQSLTTNQFAEHIIDSFPMVVDDFAESTHDNPYVQATHAYSLRFLQRFLTSFGLVTIEKKWRNDPQHFVVTELFNQVFCFK